MSTARPNRYSRSPPSDAPASTRSRSLTPPSVSLPDDLTPAQRAQRIEQIKADTSATTDRVLATLIDTRSLGASTLEQLERQGDQLDHAQKKMDNIHDDITYADWVVKGMKSIPSGIIAAIQGKPAPTYHAPTEPRAPSKIGVPELQGSKELVSPPQDEFDEKLDQISAVLADLKEIGKETNNELKLHDRKIDRLTYSVDTASARIKNTTGNVRRIT